MPSESYFHYENQSHYMIHSDLISDFPTLLIIHGLGDSSMSYREFLSTDALKNFNVLIPDLLGHGKSTGTNNYSFQHQLDGIIRHIIYLQKKSGFEFNNIILLSHSMGGIHATLFCESILQNKIKGFINIEGSITQYGSFIAHNVAKAAQENNFFKWFENFRDDKIYHLSDKYQAIHRYYDSLCLCRSDAFFQNAMEMYQMSIAVSGKYTHLIGKKYSELKLPRVYCYGESMCQETLNFLQENNLAVQYFKFSTHFFMPDCFGDIVIFLNRFVSKNID